MGGAPPVVRLITQFERCFMIFRNGAKASGLWSGWPVFGLRACRCTIAAPASAPSTAAAALSCGAVRRVDCGVGDFLGRHRQGLRHRRGVDRTGYGASDDDFAAHALLSFSWG